MDLRRSGRISVLDHWCLRSIAQVWWEHCISNAEVRRMVFGSRNARSIDELMTLHRLRWLGHVHRVVFLEEHFSPNPGLAGNALRVVR